MRRLGALFGFLVLWVPVCGSAAVMCVLEHPDHDVKRLVKEATTYKARELSIARLEPAGKSTSAANRIKVELGHALDPELENTDTPHLFYEIYKRGELVSVVLGINARAPTGVLQLFVVYTPAGKIRDLYLQRIDSPHAEAFRSERYRAQYRRFSTQRLMESAELKPPTRNPTKTILEMHHAFARALKMNILIMKHLYFSAR